MSKPNPFTGLDFLRQGGALEATEFANSNRSQPNRAASGGDEYVRVPWEWVERLRSAERVSTWRLAMLLLYEHWRINELRTNRRRTNGRDIILSNIMAEDIGMSCRSKSRALRDVEDLDLLRSSAVTERLRE